MTGCQAPNILNYYIKWYIKWFSSFEDWVQLLFQQLELWVEDIIDSHWTKLLWLVGFTQRKPVRSEMDPAVNLQPLQHTPLAERTRSLQRRIQLNTTSRRRRRVQVKEKKPSQGAIISNQRAPVTLSTGGDSTARFDLTKTQSSTLSTKTCFRYQMLTEIYSNVYGLLVYQELLS